MKKVDQHLTRYQQKNAERRAAQQTAPTALNRLTAQAPCPVVALRPPLGLGRLSNQQRDLS
jgi:hypothetical protein